MAEEILPDLYRVVVPLPDNPLKEINSYIIPSSERSLVIDTGMNREECRLTLEAGLDEIGIDLERTDFFATHLHADHQGLIPTLMRSGSRAYMGERDVESMNVDADAWSKGGAMGEYAARSGFPAEELEDSLRNHPGFKYGSQALVNFIRVKEGDSFEVAGYTLRALETPGHTYGHVCLYEPERRLLLSGDHVLGDITPNLQVWSDDQDPLDLYLKSLRKVGELPVELCLPGHRSLIEDFPRRIDELIEHHRERANEVLAILETDARTPYQTAAEMSWDIRARSWAEFPVMQRWFATGEALAHLRYLENLGKLERRVVDGQILYRSNGSAPLGTL